MSALPRRGRMALTLLLVPLALFACGGSLGGANGEPPSFTTAFGSAVVGPSEAPPDGSGEFDRGPPEDSGWAEAFSAIPDYRALASAAAPTTAAIEKFRWEWGPVFYRGRLDGTAKVLVVGQDPATDEALVHRAFIGGTGQKVQHLLEEIGVDRSYLCLNTFLYGIYGQFDGRAKALATQGPIKSFRNQLFEKTLRDNPLRLVLTFGRAAETSVQTWLDELHGGALPPGVRWVRMLHPGMAAQGHAEAQAVAGSFADGWRDVWTAKRADPSWLQADPGARHEPAAAFTYQSAPIPRRDLPFAAPPILGRGGTMTERGSATRVWLRAPEARRYAVPDLAELPTLDREASGYRPAHPEDRAWEPPRGDASHRFDPGPTDAWAALLASAPTRAEIHAAAEEDSAGTHAFDFPVWYRGQTDGSARVLVLAQDHGLDGFIAGRALVGEEGQRLTDFLTRLGAADRTLLVAVYPFPASDLNRAQLVNLAQSPPLREFREALVRHALATGVRLVLTLGEEGASALPPTGLPFSPVWVRLEEPGHVTAPASWNEALRQLEPLAQRLGLSGGTFELYEPASFSASRAQIPRGDLAFGTPLWFGTSGDLCRLATARWIACDAPPWLVGQAQEASPR